MNSSLSIFARALATENLSFSFDPTAETASFDVKQRHLVMPVWNVSETVQTMRINREEVFGPVVCALRFRTEAEAVALANDSELGLTAAVWTRELPLAMRMIRQIEAGTVWINTAGQHFVGTPFGGWKDSGLGGEECLEELLSYSRLKAVHVLS